VALPADQLADLPAADVLQPLRPQLLTLLHLQRLKMHRLLPLSQHRLSDFQSRRQPGLPELLPELLKPFV